MTTLQSNYPFTFGPPPCIFNALTVPTMIAQCGVKPRCKGNKKLSRTAGNAANIATSCICLLCQNKWEKVLKRAKITNNFCSKLDWIELCLKP